MIATISNISIAEMMKHLEKMSKHYTHISISVEGLGVKVSTKSKIIITPETIQINTEDEIDPSIDLYDLL